MDDLLAVKAQRPRLSVILIEHEMGVIERVTRPLRRAQLRREDLRRRLRATWLARSRPCAKPTWARTDAIRGRSSMADWSKSTTCPRPTTGPTCCSGVSLTARGRRDHLPARRQRCGQEHADPRHPRAHAAAQRRRAARRRGRHRPADAPHRRARDRLHPRRPQGVSEADGARRTCGSAPTW